MPKAKAATIERISVMLVVSSNRRKYFLSPPSDHPNNPAAKKAEIEITNVRAEQASPVKTERTIYKRPLRLIVIFEFTKTSNRGKVARNCYFIFAMQSFNR